MSYQPDRRFIWAGTSGFIGFLLTVFLLDWLLRNELLTVPGPPWIYLVLAYLIGAIVGFLVASRRGAMRKGS